MEAQEGARWIRGATAVTTRGLPHQGVKGGPCGIMISANSASAKTYPHICTSATFF